MRDKQTKKVTITLEYDSHDTGMMREVTLSIGEHAPKFTWTAIQRVHIHSEEEIK